jgi:hypothetical protein
MSDLERADAMIPVVPAFDFAGFELAPDGREPG